MTYLRNDQKVLDALIRHASPSGYVEDISFPVLQDAAGVGYRTLIRCLESLEQRGLLAVHRSRGRGLTNRYRIFGSLE